MKPKKIPQKRQFKQPIKYLSYIGLLLFLFSNYFLVHAMIEKRQLKNEVVQSTAQVIKTSTLPKEIKQTATTAESKPPTPEKAIEKPVKSKKQLVKKVVKPVVVKEATAKQVTEKKLQKLAKDLQQAWYTIDQGDAIPISIAILYNGKPISYQTPNVGAFQTASIVKVSIAALLMHQKQVQVSSLSADESDWLSQMIQSSDNDATTSLLNDSLGGYGALATLYKDLAMTHTTVNADAWGLTETTAEDQLKVLRQIFDSSTYLEVPSQQKISDLMSHVDEEQDWGVGSVGTSTFIKNGWLPLDDGWIVNSIGNVSLPIAKGQHYQVAILTKQNTSFESGVQLVEKLAVKTNEIISAFKL